MVFLTLVFPMSLGVLMCTERCSRVADCFGVCYDKVHLRCTLEYDKRSDPHLYFHYTPKVNKCKYKYLGTGLNTRQPGSEAVSEEKRIPTTPSKSQNLNIVQRGSERVTQKKWTARFQPNLVLIFTRMIAPGMENQTYLYLTKTNEIVQLPIQDKPQCGTGINNYGKYTILLGNKGIHLYSFTIWKEITFKKTHNTKYVVSAMAADQLRLVVYYSQKDYLLKWDLTKNTHQASNSMIAPLYKIIVHPVGRFVSLYYIKRTYMFWMLYSSGRSRNQRVICSSKKIDMSIDSKGQVYYADYSEADPNCRQTWPHQKDFKCDHVDVIGDFTIWTCPSHRQTIIVDKVGRIVQEIKEEDSKAGERPLFLGYMDTKLRPMKRQRTPLPYPF